MKTLREVLDQVCAEHGLTNWEWTVEAYGDKLNGEENLFKLVNEAVQVYLVGVSEIINKNQEHVPFIYDDTYPAFLEWAELYFHHSTGRLDQIISKSGAFSDFKKSTKATCFSTARFTHYCKCFAASHHYIFNPVGKLNSQGRILREIDGVRQEGIFFSTIISAPFNLVTTS